MSSDDIRDLRRRHRLAVRRSLAGGLRRRLRLCRARSDDASAFPLAPLQRPHRRVRRQAREPRAPAARGARGDARGVRGPRRRRLPDRRRRAAGRRRHRPRRDRGAARPRRRAPGSLGLHGRLLGGRLDHLPLRPRGLDGGALPRPQAADLEARRRRRLADLARHDGPARPRRRARPDRRRAAVDRRPVPAEEDRGGPAGRHPRVHRLQRLRHRRLDGDPDPLHAEPVDGRGVAPRLASRAHPAQGLRRQGARRRRRALRGSKRRRCSGSAATTWCSPRRRASSAGG